MGKLDLVNFWEVVLFSWLTGNSDMHLKNFSLYEPSEGLWRLAPAYDLLAVHLAMPSDREELALTLNGKKNNIKPADFIEAMSKSGIGEVVVRRMIYKFISLLPTWEEIIGRSFLPRQKKLAYCAEIGKRVECLKNIPAKE